ncbi:hypothetical protein Tco_0096570, partial [Tanacetum coccineum]
VRIEKTKRSKNNQNPTRNGKKTKSQEQDKEFSQRSQPDQPDSVKERDKGSQRAIIDKSPKSKEFIWKIEVSRTKFAKC